MKKLYTLIVVMIGLIGFSSTSHAQCANDNTLQTTIDATTITTATTLSTCTFGGEYLLITNMQSGSTYTFETCGDTGFDTQLSIFNDASGAVVGFNDDFCGLQSSVSFVSDGSSVRVSLDQFNCQSNTTCMTIVGSVAGPAGDPCASISPILACGDTGSFSLIGTGLFDGNGPFSTPGGEQIFSFTATTTGAHLIDVTNSSGFVDLFFIDAALGCSGSGWTYVDDILTSASNAVNLTAGTTYYFLIDDENTTASSGTITINCPSAIDPCANITPIADCGATASFSLSGIGAFDGNGPFSTPGAEQIFSFTATTTGAHLIDVTNTSGFVDLFFVDAAGGCSGTGWTYVDDILTSASNIVNLTAGTTYYFMIDDENTTASDGTITINCPSGFDPCANITVLDGCDISDTYSIAAGIGAFDNIGPFSTPGQEVIFEYTAPFDGDYEIEITHTGGSFVDFFFADASAGCSAGAGWTYVDDILTTATNTVNLTAGTTYYFLIDDENNAASDGTISIECPCIVSSSPDSTFVYSGPFTVSGSTDDACNDCDLRPSEDRVYAIEIPCAGTYTFETCGSSFDTYLYLSSDFCSNVIDFNDDSPCGGGFSLQSSITATLQPGTYYVTVEAFSSLVTGDFDLSVSGTEDIIDIEIDTFMNVSCFGGSDGSATAVVSSGTMPFNYQWSDGQTTAMASGLSIGTYTVTGTDANGCVSDTATVTLTEPTELLGFTSCPALVCYDGVADMAVFAFGGTPPYTGTGIFSVGVGTHTYTITDANGCSVTVSHTVTAPPPLVFNITYAPIPCNGGTTDVTVSGSGGTGTLVGTFGTFNFGAGTYTYTMTDANGCTADTTITITEPAVLVASASADTILCNGGSADVTITATGGTAPYMGTGVFSQMAGTTTYTVTDANGCTATTTVTLTEPTPIQVFVSCPAILCNGGTVDIGVTAFGGTPPYSGTGVFNLGAGTYTFTVTDANGCTASSTHTVTEPPALVVNIASTGIDCNGGTADITVTASGGTGPYSGDLGTFTVSAGTYSYTVTDANGCTTTETITVTEPPVLMASATLVNPILCNGGTGDVTVSATGGTPPYTGTGSFSETAGTYTYTVTDANGCTATTMSVTLTEPPALQVFVSCPAILCNGGTVDIGVAAFGGTPPYTGTGVFNLGAGTYTFTVTDANGCTASSTHTVTEPSPLVISISTAGIDCNGGTADVTVTASGGTAPYSGDLGTFNVGSGTYTYTVTDANGCTTTDSITLVDPPVLTASVSAGSILCNGGTADVTVTATGGTPPYMGTGTFSEVAGTYTYTVTDANGCTATTTSVTLTEPTALQVFISCPAILCNGGTTDIAVAAFGGTPPYVGTGVFNVSAGTYTYTVTDANGCSETVSHTVTEPAPLAISVTATPVSCSTGNADVTVSASGGTAPYMGTGMYSVVAGTYTYMVTDANGCSASETIVVDPCVPTYCESYATCSSYEWINCVTIGSIYNYSGNNGGYGDFTSMVTNASPGGTVSLNLAPGFSGQSYYQAWRVWVDWNNDGDFSDQNEFIGQGMSNSTMTGTITVPQNAVQNTNLRVRVSMQWACHRYPGPCEIFTYGEVEDYSIYVTTSSSGGGLNGMATNNSVVSVDKETEFTQSEIVDFTSIDPASNKSDNIDNNAAIIQGVGIEVANIYPNPVLSSNGVFNLELRAGSSTDVTVRIVDLSGKVMYTDAVHLEKGVNENTMDVTGFARGSYVIEIISGDHKGTTQLIVQ